MKFLNDFLIRKSLLDYKDFVYSLSEVKTSELLKLINNPIIRNKLLFLNSDFVKNIDLNNETDRVTFLVYLYKIFTKPVPLNYISGIQYFGESIKSNTFEYHILSNNIIKGSSIKNPTTFNYGQYYYYYEFKENILTDEVKCIEKSAHNLPQIEPTLINQNEYLKQIKTSELKYQY